MVLSSFDDLTDKRLLNGGKIRYHDVYSMVFLLLYLLKDDPTYASLSDLVYTLDQENFIKFLTIFGGSTIKVPTKNEVDDAFKALMVYQLHEVEKQDGRAVRHILKLNDLSKSRQININKMADKTKDIMKSLGASNGFPHYGNINKHAFGYGNYEDSQKGLNKPKEDKDESSGKS